jgi:methylglutaconyl-CoA hydratase
MRTMSIKTERRGRVLVVTLDRPQARNAFDLATIEALKETFEAIQAPEPPPFDDPDHPDARGLDYRPQVVLLRAEGPIFCAGADLGDMERLGQAGFQENLQAALTMGAMFRAIRLCPAPVVARVQGPAYGGGAGMICACDVVVSSPEAKFAFSEVRLGLVAGVIAPLVIDRIGQAAARHSFLTGDPISAVDALRIGLVDRLAGQEGLDEAVDRAIVSLLKGGPAALGRIKALVEGTVTLGFDRSLDFTARMIAEARTSEEAQAALAAFFAKEPAPWARRIPWPPGQEGQS